jgi:hypothetical protein
MKPDDPSVIATAARKVTENPALTDEERDAIACCADTLFLMHLDMKRVKHSCKTLGEALSQGKVTTLERQLRENRAAKVQGREPISIQYTKTGTKPLPGQKEFPFTEEKDDAENLQVPDEARIESDDRDAGGSKDSVAPDAG